MVKKYETLCRLMYDETLYIIWIWNFLGKKRSYGAGFYIFTDTQYKRYKLYHVLFLNYESVGYTKRSAWKHLYKNRI